mmetsp:Transcript_20756/g.24740  ORF Transcript_20756/g.24740 Transcript_20756/m.24740 type:complete len:386 (+) Transcript_20756:31-1188(+)
MTMANLSQRNTTKLVVWSLLVAYVFLSGISLALRGRNRNLESEENLSNLSNLRNLASKENVRPTYDMSCPLAMIEYIHVGQQIPEAARYSVQSGAQSVITEALESDALTDRKIIMIGDSNMRQVFSSLSCIAHTAGFWKDDNAYTAGTMPGYYPGMYYDARLNLKGGLGEVFYSPTAGNIQNYGWTRDTPLQGNEDWLQNCRDRKPFYLDTYTYDAPNVGQTYSENDDRFEKVLLGGKDVVFINAGLHLNARDQNMVHLLELVDCMKAFKHDGEDPGWPQIFYVRSNQQHFNNADEGGAFPISRNGPTTCLESVDIEKNSFFRQDKATFQGKLPMVGFDLDLGGVGKLHIGMGGRLDCSHWAMPGVPDAYAREIAAAILTIGLED